MTDDEYGRGVQLGEMVGSLKSLTKKVDGLAEDVQSLRQTFARLTGGHRALLWVISALSVVLGMIATLFDGVLSRHH